MTIHPMKVAPQEPTLAPQRHKERLTTIPQELVTAKEQPKGETIERDATQEPSLKQP